MQVNRDGSNGYEEIASIFIPGRGRNAAGLGASVVAEWADGLPEGASVLDVGCGTGVPITLVLVERGFAVYGVDGSPRMVAAFRERFPGIPVACEAVEDSAFFGRRFEGVVAWGLMFLLDEASQRGLIAKVAGALAKGGRLLFTAPSERCTWADAMTGRASISLGYEEYRSALEAAGISLVDTRRDEGGNHYYLGLKT